METKQWTGTTNRTKILIEHNLIWISDADSNSTKVSLVTIPGVEEDYKIGRKNELETGIYSKPRYKKPKQNAYS